MTKQQYSIRISSKSTHKDFHMKVKLRNMYDTDTLMGCSGNFCNVGEDVIQSFSHLLPHCKHYRYCLSACQYHTYYKVLLSCGNFIYCYAEVSNTAETGKDTPLMQNDSTGYEHESSINKQSKNITKWKDNFKHKLSQSCNILRQPETTVVLDCIRI